MCGKYFDGELLNGYTTIFGETSFTNMGVTLVKATNNYIYDEVSKSLKVLFPHVMIDQNRLEKWVKLCLKLENIPESELIDMASLKKITDLEAKLAEKEYLLNIKDGELNNVHKLWQNKIDEVNQLKQQLAEKDEEIERWKEQYFTEIGALSYAFNQAFVLDKIEFAVEQLEKVKELVEEKSMTQSPFGTQKIYASDVSAIVDSQIEELKKEMK